MPARAPEQKKTPPRVFFFFAAAPAKGKGRRSPVGRRHRARAKKKNTPRVFFFCSGPGETPSPVFPRGRSKKKHTLGGVFFFALAPCRRPTGLLLPLPFAGSQQKNHPGWCFFFWLWPRAGTGLLLPLPFPGAGAKKKTPWVVFFFRWPRRKVAAPNGAQQKKKHFAHPGPTAKIFSRNQ